MKVWRLAVIIYLLCAGSALCREIPRTLSFSKDAYGAQNQNWMFALRKDQMLAVANSAGVMLFDGSRWSVYPMPDNQIVRAVATDESGHIFCGGYGSFGFWRGDERGRLVYHDLSEEAGGAIGEIWNIVVLPGRVIFQTFSEIYQYDYQRVRKITPPGTIMFLTEVEGRLLAPSVQYGLFELKASGDFELLPGTEALAEERVATILPAPEGGYLIGAQNSGFYRYADNQVVPLTNPVYDEIKENQLNRGLRLSNGNYVFGTILNGVYLLDASSRQLLFHLNKENGLQNNTVLALMEDPSHNLWVGMDKGINYVQLKDQLVYFNDEASDIGTVYSAVLHRDILYVGSNQGVYYKRWRPAGGREAGDQHFRLIPGSQGQVWQLKVFDGQLLAGHNQGTFLIEDQKLKQISSEVGGWHTVAVPERPDRLVQATYTGLVLFKKGADGRWSASHKLEGFSQSLRKIEFDENGRLWGVNPHRGLFRFELNDQCDTILSMTAFSRKEGLPTEYRPDIFRIDGRLHIKSGEQFLKPAADGLSLEPVHTAGAVDLSPGDYKVLYCSPGNYFKVYAHYVEWRRAGEKQRLDLSLVPNYEQIVRLSPDHFLICLDEGYALLDQQKETAAVREAPEPLLTEIKVNGKHSLYPVFQETSRQPWTFSPSEKRLQFFAGLPDLSKGHLLEYRLTGYEEDWQPLQNYAKEFTNLPPGDYQFEVRITGTDRRQSFSFIILPKWYQTLAAKIIYVLLLGLVLWMLFVFQEKRLEIHLRKLHIEKERQMHLQRMEARNEQLQANILNKSKELANTTMSLIQKNEILIRIKKRLGKVKSNLSNPTSYSETQKLLHLIDRHLTNEQDWELFEKNFSQVHESFLKKLKEDYPELTPGDLRLAAYLKMNLSSKEIAPLLNISIRGVENKRYRLRSKLGLRSNDNLTEFMMRY
jgi:DNA-binding CsgD family transcriptional regulator